MKVTDNMVALAIATYDTVGRPTIPREEALQVWRAGLEAAIGTLPDMEQSLKDELADYEKQFAEAQQQTAFWNQKMLVASGAAQACKALLTKMEIPDETPSPAP